MPTWTSPRTWVDGETPTGSQFNTQFRDNLAYLKDSPTFDGDVTVTGTLIISGANIVTGAGLCEGRLTLTSGNPATTSDVTAAGTLYWAPFRGGRVGLYDGSSWVTYSPGQLSISVPATTSQMYDVFLDYNGGTPALSLTAWTNDTTRATALTTQDDVRVLTGSTGKRFIGCIRTTTASGQTEDSGEKRFVWNYYNRLPRSLKRVESTDSWTYTLATYRQANNSTDNQVAVIVGIAEVPVDLTSEHYAQNPQSVGLWSGIGYDSVTVPIASAFDNINASNVKVKMPARIVHYPAIGYHYYALLERSQATDTTTWYGDNGDATLTQSGLFGWVEA